ncbi:related to PUS7 - Pseudouridine synthase [Melanopsichium pennsylvanicum]|uniref:Related to PUS7 - Pseudouridine synthase n=2 Tax=Melanopsichium pennsylvanicum TaxID=63383 RepID=A0AAJ5C6C5_9BASI|nr:related to PUS7-Pseudouridine synthase [Melanopsichium pennsylvanicum 4]SNX85697.1 related to PUS7 - Pseudouridine synthase [Melanopsichium pennsylvanicum]
MADTDRLKVISEASEPVAKRVKHDRRDAYPTENGDQVETRMTEVKAGITAYIDASLPGFQGIIKQRFTDFMVNEIDPSGTVCRLTSLDPPPGKYLAQLRPESSAISSDSTTSQGPAKVEADAAKIPQVKVKAEVEFGLWPSDADEKLSEFFPTEAITELKEMWSKGRSGESMGTGANATVISAASAVTNPLRDKAQRTQVHQLIRELFHGKLATDSCQVRPMGARRMAEVDEDALANGASNMAASTRIAVRWANRSDRRLGDDLSEEARYSPPYVHFLLQKTNRDHQEAMGMLAELMRLGGGGGGRGRGRGRGSYGGGRGGGRPPTKDLGVAGTKDKRAVTVQMVSLKRNRKTLEDVYRLVNGINADVSVSKGKGKSKAKTVVEATTTRGERGIRIGHLTYAHEPLNLGQLKGNEFTITLRNIRPSSYAEISSSSPPEFVPSIHSSMATVRDRGFVNYFGMQRFGTGAIPTHHIGILILKSDFASAIDLLFTPRGASSPTADDGDSADLLKAKQLYKDGEFEKAYWATPKNCVAEKHILDRMRSGRWNKGDWMGAFGNIPRTLRSMYIHAYQSYVWNRLVSERVKRLGSLDAVEGDLVFADELGDDAWGEEAEAEESIADKEEVEDEDEKRNNDNTKSETLATWQRPIKVLTKADLDQDESMDGSKSRRSYTIYNVVMPLPGSSIDVPPGWMSDLYASILASDGLTHDQLISSKIPEYQLRGSYRRMIVKPRNFDYRITTYTDPDVPLTYTDEELCLDPSLSNIFANGENKDSTDQAKERSNGKGFTALTLKFQLPSSSYATMLMREALKSDTSSFKHRQMTQKSEDQLFKGSAQA